MIVERDLQTFLVVGGIATGSHYLLLITLMQLTNIEPTIAATSGFILGAIVSYSLNHRITFRSSRSHSSAIPRFIVAAITGMLLNALIFMIGLHLARFHYLVAQAISSIIVLFWNYLLNKHWAFSKPSLCSEKK